MVSRTEQRQFPPCAFTEEFSLSFVPFGDRELPYDEVEDQRHDCGGMYQHCKRADAINNAMKWEGG